MTLIVVIGAFPAGRPVGCWGRHDGVVPGRGVGGARCPRDVDGVGGVVGEHCRGGLAPCPPRAPPRRRGRLTLVAVRGRGGILSTRVPRALRGRARLGSETEVGGGAHVEVLEVAAELVRAIRDGGGLLLTTPSNRLRLGIHHRMKGIHDQMTGIREGMGESTTEWISPRRHWLN